jgi:hypothetical protein
MVNYNSDRMNLIRSARTVKDINVQVQVITKQVRSTSSKHEDLAVAPKSITISLSAPLGRTIEQGDMLPTGKQAVRPAATVKPLVGAVDLESFDSTKLKGRARASNNQAIMQQAYQELAVAYQILQSKALGGTSESTRGTALKAIKDLLTEITGLIAKYRRQASVPKDEIPNDVMDISKKLYNSVKKVVDGSSVSRITPPEYYVAKHDMEQDPETHGLVDTITYQSFIRLDDFTNDEDVVYHDYAVVLTTQVNTETGKAHFFLTTLTNAMTPGTFQFGKEVSSKEQLVSRLNELLAIDGADRFVTKRVPIPATTQQLKTLTSFGIHAHKINGRSVLLVDDLRVQNSKLYVRLAMGLSNAEKKLALDECFAMFSAAFRNTIGKIKKTDIVYKFESTRSPKSKDVREYIVMSLVSSAGASRGLKTNQAIMKIAQALELSNEDAQRISQALK